MSERYAVMGWGGWKTFDDYDVARAWAEQEARSCPYIESEGLVVTILTVTGEETIPAVQATGGVDE